MSLCVSTTKARTPCQARAKYDGYCGIHHAKKRRDDPVYDRVWEEGRNVVVYPVPAPVPGPVPAAGLLLPAEAPEAQALLEAQRLQAERAAAKRAKNQRILAGLARPSLHKFLSYATKLIALWKHESIPGMECAKAYIILKYMPLHNVTVIPHMIAVVQAVARIYLLAEGRHPDVARYADVPAAEKNAALVALLETLRPFEGENVLTGLLPRDDPYAVDITRRHQEEMEELARQRREAAERARAELRLEAEHAEQRRLNRVRLREREEQRQRQQFENDLRERPVVFRRDPEGGIDIRAFATDHQNVHRSSVQTSTQKACLTLMARPLGEGQETLPELVTDLENPARITYSTTRHRERVITELTHDYFETEAFSLRYGAVLDRVWAFIRSHVHRQELFVRLAQEINEGLGQCSNGKMARLVNALQGFDDTLEMDPPKEMFQNSISMLTRIPVEEREPRARALFLEYAIPEGEQPAWLEHLLLA
jgi:hypothetical protein